jgi:hypothetical protein
MEITLRPNKTNPKETAVVKVPKGADQVVGNDCGNNETQQMSLRWTDPQKNSSKTLNRSLTIEFQTVNDTW